jgi:hypothetical protein
MALLAPTASSGDFMDICKYDARAGRIFRVDRAEDGSKTPVDITRSFKAVFDFENVEVGWMLFAIGGAPDFRMVRYGDVMPAKPTPEHKQGIRMRIKLHQSCGGDVREIAGTANAFLVGVNALHDAYLAGVASNPGKLPVVVLEDTIAVESGGGQKRSTNYQPVFAIAGWAARPSGLEASKASAAATALPGSRIVPHDDPIPFNKPAAASAVAAAGDDDFG